MYALPAGTSIINADDVSMDIDGVLEKIGDFGPSQKKIYYLVSLTHLWMATIILLPSFTGVDPGWRCVADGSNQLRVVTSTDIHSRCRYYEQGSCTPDYSTEFTSIVTQWNLICDKSSLPNLSQSGYFVGLLIGAWVFGTITDMIGRRKVYFMSTLCAAVCSILSGLAPGFYFFVFFRIAFAFFSVGIGLASYSIFMEITGLSQRTFAGMAVHVFSAAGYLVLAVMAYLIRDWRTLSVIAGLAGFPSLLLWRVVPESPRWLLVHGRGEEAREVLGRLARGNGTQLPAGELKKPPSTGGEKVSVLDLFRGRNIRQRTIMLVISWFTNCMVYYGLAMSAGNLGGNRYISFSLSASMDIPAMVVTYCSLDRIGRKWIHGGFLLVGSSGCLAWTVLHLLSASSSLKVIAALIGKFAVAGSFATAHLYTAELFPTQVRSLGTGVASIGARVGGILSPLVLLLASTSAILPMLLMGALALLTGLLSLTLPETLNKPLPETLAGLE